MSEVLNPALSRRRVLQAAAVFAGVGVWQLGSAVPAFAAGTSSTTAAAAVDPVTAMTLEAFADTIVPGEKRFAGDVAVAGAAAGPSAAAAGFLDLMALPGVGLVTVLPGLAMMTNGEAQGYAQAVGLLLDPELPPFVALPYAHRAGLVASLVSPDRPDQAIWALMASLSGWCFDNAAGFDTATAIRDGHPGLAWLKFPAPDSDGLWRFPKFSYRRELARRSPMTSCSGSPR